MASRQTKKATSTAAAEAVAPGALAEIEKLISELKAVTTDARATLTDIKEGAAECKKMIGDVISASSVIKISREQLEEIAGGISRLEAKVDQVFTAEGTRKPVSKPASKTASASGPSSSAPAGAGPNAKAKASQQNILTFYKTEYIRNPKVFDSVLEPEGDMTVDEYKAKLFKEIEEKLKGKNATEQEKIRAATLWAKMTKGQKDKVRNIRADIEQKRQNDITVAPPVAAPVPVVAATASASRASKKAGSVAPAPAAAIGAASFPVVEPIVSDSDVEEVEPDDDAELVDDDADIE